jgi:hypothetical protein
MYINLANLNELHYIVLKRAQITYYKCTEKYFWKKWLYIQQTSGPSWGLLSTVFSFSSSDLRQKCNVAFILFQTPSRSGGARLISWGERALLILLLRVQAPQTPALFERDCDNLVQVMHFAVAGLFNCLSRTRASTSCDRGNWSRRDKAPTSAKKDPN